MKKLILSATAFLSAVVCMQAQTTTDNTLDSKVNSYTAKMTKACNLTPDQVTKIKPFVSQGFQAMAANKEKYATDKAARKAANEQSRQAVDKNIQSILRPDQVDKYKSFEKSMEVKKSPSTERQTAK
jgi:hypothetical protein